jgi:plastocyanin
MTPAALPHLLVAVALLATACSAADPVAEPAVASAPSASAGTTIEVVNIAFKPAEVHVLRSTEVTWNNGDDGVAHTVTSGIGGSNAVPGVSEADARRMLRDNKTTRIDSAPQVVSTC